MDTSTFFEKFELIADAPDAITRLRELILDLAIQGRLTSHENTKFPSFKLGDIAEQITKGTTPTTLGHPFMDSGVSFVKVENISEGRIQNTNISKFISEETHEILKRSQLQKNDILFSIAGTIGKTCIVQELDTPANTNQALAIIRGVTSHLDVDYLKLQLDSFVSNSVKDKARGGAMRNVSLGDLRSLKVMCPPLAEQKRIVAKVDELMALCDQLEAQQQEREQQRAQLNRAALARFSTQATVSNLNYIFHQSYHIPPSDLRKTILTLAVQGKLVPQDHNDEPIEGQKTESNFPLPKSWNWFELDKLILIKHGYAFKSEHFTSDPTDYIVATPGNFYEEGGFRERGNKTKYYKSEPPEDFILSPNDLIIPMTEQAAGLLGSPAFIPNDGKAYLHNQRLGLIQPKSDSITLTYLACYFRSPYFRKEIGDTATGMKVRHTSPKKILKIGISLPPAVEQRRIVAKVDQLMALVDQLEAQLKKSRSTATNLLTALVAELTSSPR